MLTDESDPQSIAQQNNLIQQSDSGALEEIINQILADNPEAVNEIKSGSKKSKKIRAFLLGQVMQKTKGQANPKIVSEILSKKLG